MTGGWMRATSPAGDASFEGVVQWTGDLGFGVKAPEAGQSGNRDDARTGSKQLRRAFFRHLNAIDVNDDQRGVQGMMSMVEEKMTLAQGQDGRAPAGEEGRPK